MREELIDGGASVVAVVHEQARGKGSGVPHTFRIAQGGKADALEAAGLRE
jgi:hypothetical protein